MMVTAPGKLMLSGEWSVLEVGFPCIVMAINQRVGVEIKKSKSIIIHAPDLGITDISADFSGGKLHWKNTLDEKKQGKLLIAKNAIELSLAYLQSKNHHESELFEIKTFSSDTTAKPPNGTIAKVGFGSSAAVCVAIVGAILKLNGYDLLKKETKDLVFKIACTAHYLAQGKVGSSFDIAASTYGGALVYTRFDPDWLTKEMGSGKSVAQLLDSDWPAFTAENMKLPERFELLVGFVGYSASTKELILRMNSFKETQKEHYWQIIDSIKTITMSLIDAIKQNNEELIIELIKQNRKQLLDLSNASQCNLETKEHTILAEIAEKYGCAGKFSGAGGGDCGIAISFDKEKSKKIKNAWKRNGITPLRVKIDFKGVSCL